MRSLGALRSRALRRVLGRRLESSSSSSSPTSSSSSSSSSSSGPRLSITPPREGAEGGRGADPPLWDARLLRARVQREDAEAYAVSHFVPARARLGFFALRVFNLETASVYDASRGNAQAASMRFGFWRDLVDAVFAGRPHAHPFVPALATVVREHSLTQRFFHRIIDARALDAMPDSRPQTLEDLDVYGEHTASSLLYLMLETLGVRGSGAAPSAAVEATEAAASHIGRATAIATLLRGFPHHCRIGQVYLPRELLDAQELSTNQVLQSPAFAEQLAKEAAADPATPAPVAPGSPEEAFRLKRRAEAQRVTERVLHCTYEVACHAHAHLEAARAEELRRQVDPAALPVLRFAVPTGRFLAHLEQLQFDPTHPHLQPRDRLGLLWSLVQHTWRRSY